MLDVWCAGVVADCEFRKAITSWNVVQAVIRQTGRMMENVFVSLQLSGFVSLLLVESKAILLFSQRPLGFALYIDLVSMLPLLLLALFVARLSIQTAAVTEKCSDVPSLVNQLEPDAFDEISQLRDRLFLAESITHSAAGIYVKRVRFGGFALGCGSSLVLVCLLAGLCFLRA